MKCCSAPSARDIKKIYKLGFLFLCIGLCASCTEDRKSVNKNIAYKGPWIEVENAETLYSDSAVIRIKVLSDRQIEFMGGDREFPEGIFIEFYEKNGKLTTTLKANSGYFFAKDNKYRVLGDVEVQSLEKKQTLNTEKLYWKPDDEEVFTDRFVRIETTDEILMGEGLTAKQDFSSYRILKPTGTLSIEDDLLEDE